MSRWVAARYWSGHRGCIGLAHFSFNVQLLSPMTYARMQTVSASSSLSNDKRDSDPDSFLHPAMRTCTAGLLSDHTARPRHRASLCQGRFPDLLGPCGAPSSLHIRTDWSSWHSHRLSMTTIAPPLRRLICSAKLDCFAKKMESPKVYTVGQRKVNFVLHSAWLATFFYFKAMGRKLMVLLDYQLFVNSSFLPSLSVCLTSHVAWYEPSATTD